jgi:hypothetical protein
MRRLILLVHAQRGARLELREVPVMPSQDAAAHAVAASSSHRH